MTSSLSSSPLSYASTPSPELIKTRLPRKSYHIEIGLIILFLCLTIPSLFFLTLIYRRQTTDIPTIDTFTSTPTTEFPFFKTLFSKNFYRKSLINYPQARCMDNSIASYYIRLAGNNQARWLIYFDGGWFCYSKESCHFRQIYSPKEIARRK